MDLNEDFFSDLTIVSGGNEVIEETKVYKDAEGRLYNVAPGNVEDFLREHVNAQEAGLAFDPQGVDVDQSYTQQVEQVEKVAFDPLNQNLSGTFMEGLTVVEDTQMQDLVEFGFKGNKYDQALEIINSPVGTNIPEEVEYEEVDLPEYSGIEDPDLLSIPIDPNDPVAVATAQGNYDGIDGSGTGIMKDSYGGEDAKIAKLSTQEDKEIAAQTNSSVENIKLAKQGLIDQDKIQTQTPNDLYTNLVFTSDYVNGTWDINNSYKYPNNIGDANGAVPYTEQQRIKTWNQNLNHQAPILQKQDLNYNERQLRNEYIAKGNKIVKGDNTLLMRPGVITTGQIKAEAKEIENRNRRMTINMYVTDDFRRVNEFKNAYLGAIERYGPNSKEAFKAKQDYSKVHKDVMNAEQMFDLGTGEEVTKRGKFIDERSDHISKTTTIEDRKEKANFLMYKLFALHEVMRSTDFADRIGEGANLYDWLTEQAEYYTERLEMSDEQKKRFSLAWY